MRSTMKIIRCTPIKPKVARVEVELWQDNFIRGEYAIAVDLDKFMTVPESETEDPTFDVQAFQQHVTNEIAALQTVGSISNRLTGLAWTVITDKEKEEQAEDTSDKEHTDQS